MLMSGVFPIASRIVFMRAIIRGRIWSAPVQVLVATALILGIAYFDPIYHLPINHRLGVFLDHALSLGISIYFIRSLAPVVKPLIRLPRFDIRFNIGAFFAIFMSANFIGGIKDGHSSFGHWVLAVIAALGVGLTEEFFVRGYIFGVFSRWGLWPAAIGSSLFFGLLHLSNYFAGQGFGPTIAQVISASGFGFFACGITVFARSIYPAVLVHSMIDLPVMLSDRHFASVHLERGELKGAASLALTYFVLGLLFLLGAFRYHKLEPLLIKWKLTEPPS